MKKKKYKILISAIPLVPIFKKYQKYFDNKKYSIDLKKTDHYLNEAQLLKIIYKYHGVICGDDEFSKSVLEKASNLKVISKWGTGINSIDLNFAKQKKLKF